MIKKTLCFSNPTYLSLRNGQPVIQLPEVVIWTAIFAIADSATIDRIRYQIINFFLILIIALNLWLLPSYTIWGVYDGPKIKNFKQFTTFIRLSLLSELSEGCLWWSKDKEFQAIHNYTVSHFVNRTGVYDGPKIKNFKQFTTSSVTFLMYSGCLWWSKDKEFQAIHNGLNNYLKATGGVYDGPKIKNFKQFTTEGLRYRDMSRCLWWSKDKEFQAIHNQPAIAQSVPGGVYDGPKIKNFKQFTTYTLFYIFAKEVSMMVQR